MSELIQEVNLADLDKSKYKSQFVGAIVVAQDNRILLQQRSQDCKTFPGFLSEFGGKIEIGESPLQALLRELEEELGAKADKSDIISLGAITEKATNYSELIHVYFWHDKQGSMTGCYEDTAKYFNAVSEIVSQSNLMDSARWMLQKCQTRGLVK